MRVFKGGVAAGVLVLALTACASGRQTDGGAAAWGKAPGAAALPHTWVGTSATGALMVQMTRDGRALSGSLDSTALVDGDPTRSTTAHWGFTGTLDGSAFTMNVRGDVLTRTTFTGTVSAGRMQLLVPDRGTGTIQAAELRPGTVDQYNRAVRSVTGRAAAAAAQATREAQEQAQAQASEEAAAQVRAQIDSAAGAVSTAYGDLSDALDQAPDYSSFESDIATAEQDLATTRTDAAQARAMDKDDPEACGQADTAQGDADTVQGDADTVQGDLDTLTGAVDSLSTLLAALKDAYGAYRTAQAQTSSYVPLVASAADVNALEARAATAMATMTSKGNGYLAHANQLAAQAASVAGTAESEAC
ncbi:hypothetical protein VSR01_19295 [Actinacidiphila sp. DG2A-62]|uniref:hypothetical protein n=1 Tax=Actinacidiphila sp. DG2A-62 TaxID=3108821 RepID=UPI002DB979D2|nr:hypothetical protein [Actinacidiphila sp. DG2A-62]MEC3995555.1 hypothetical protein [Actinacidiphila sp. DG2A-62]